MKKSVAATCLAVFSTSIATGAMAEDLVIPLPKDTTVEKVETVYQCAADKVEAVYFNAGEISLVRLGLKDGVTVAANVISGSGAKYQGGMYVWWSKGDEADLYDLMADPQMKQPVHCIETKKS
ncbi:MliC family protein [Agrobacterium salinitolerans]|uniref:MliC family protein n=1 Tax=Agrobacterium salinitolerans TaxID=1183413 RepID=A0A4Z1QXT4_9HYPH|nr:MliC family protein [Agrobacterium salinitolerans]MCZ7862831.1 MliC family protein [Agrobacterium salinitolerans]QXC49722.1 MliC family protein [Agrobacterium salinitolerans]UYZ06342.1 MliC family protein [Agrobacterium salinitolerans]